ncbi:MAG TPA: hypothetical protein VJ023_01055 [Pyrinomonadaceae bacterium]|nr:hypothetical protein [Pyrinomonadaceae bacterium]
MRLGNRVNWCDVESKPGIADPNRRSVYDHISIHLAFVVSSIVSIFLVVSYLRLVVGIRFASREAALAQFVYLVAFSYAFFLEGFTGLAVTIGSIVTLFVAMQSTGRIRWAERFAVRPLESPAGQL